MAIFYRGAGVGTWWHVNDPRLSGFVPRSPAMLRTPDRLMNHIAKTTTTSPFVSLTRSWGVALTYALDGKAPATKDNPGLIWEIEIGIDNPTGLELLDPVREVATRLSGPLTTPPYQHDGSPQCLVALIDRTQDALLRQPCPQPPGTNPPAKGTNITTELQTLVFALRDAEILAFGVIPPNCIVNRYEVF